MCLGTPGFKGKSEIHCSHCTDEDGNFTAARADVQKAIASWFRTWQPNLDEETAMKRADLYLRAMPEWADD